MDQRAGRRARPWGEIVFIGSAGAAAIHFAAAGPHFEQYRPAGSFMLLSAVAQLVSGLCIARGAGPGARDIAVMLNTGIVGVWLWSRTLGLPFGPDAGIREHVHVQDALATGLELVVIAALLMDARGVVARRGVAAALVRAVGFCSLMSITVAAHDAAHEQRVAFAALLLSLVLRSFVATVPLVIPGRDHVQITRLTRFAAAARVGGAARSGAR